MSTILITGDRNYSDIKTIEFSFDILQTVFPPETTKVIHGGCKGADILSGKVASKRGFTTQEFPAEWNKYGKGAGPIRNKEMVMMHPDVVCIFHYDLWSSKGTKHCVNILLNEISEKYKPIILFNSKITSKNELLKILKGETGI